MAGVQLDMNAILPMLQISRYGNLMSHLVICEKPLNYSNNANLQPPS